MAAPAPTPTRAPGPSSGPLRCPWARGELLTAYHDQEWGVATSRRRAHFELISLEGAQAGLSWLTILRRRPAYRRLMLGFDATRLAALGPEQVEMWLRDPGLIRNRAKLSSVLGNARAFLEIEGSWGSFDAYLARGVGLTPVRNHWRRAEQVPAQTEDSRRLSRDLRRRGFRFVGPTICYAYMQSVGLVNDHLQECYRWAELD
ncbi:MAG: DNA-3-methyladenine glycosylase I [Candidatus Dormibacteria bacterium]